MRPANTTHTNNLLEAFEETWPEVSRAMPWILPEKDIEPQLADFLDETERTGRVGKCTIGYLFDLGMRRSSGF